ncbi:MAG: hypothetical protein HY366_00145 [Candidatus Aenigmarchaeota archaeon]|nr:hypothetical protein [Candidatus Aenigmarchaeota archaeon]
MNGNRGTNKGVSLYVSHMLALALLLAAFGFVSIGITNYYKGVSEKGQEAQALVVSQLLAENIVKLEYLYKNSVAGLSTNGTNITLAELVLDVPQKISGKPYVVTLTGHQDFWIINNVTVSGENKTILQESRPQAQVTITTDGPPSITFSYNIYNVVAALEGSAQRTDRIKLTYMRELVSGVTTDRVVLSGA